MAAEGEQSGEWLSCTCSCSRIVRGNCLTRVTTLSSGRRYANKASYTRSLCNFMVGLLGLCSIWPPSLLLPSEKQKLTHVFEMNTGPLGALEGGLHGIMEKHRSHYGFVITF